MKTTNIKNFAPANVKNSGDAKEWAYCSYRGIERVKHDSKPYNVASDVEINEEKISIKASKFSLMSGKLCNGLTDFDKIWELYETNTHSNKFVYITEDFTAYEMNITEFKTFIYTFCKTEKESEKNGGAVKIRCKTESKKMIEWFQAKAWSYSFFYSYYTATLLK